MIDEKTTLLSEIPILKSNDTARLLPEDAYECKIIEIEENEKVSSYSKKKERGAIFTFEITEGIYKGKLFTAFFTNKLTKRSKLTVLCRAVWGDEFKPEEMAQLNVMEDFKRFLMSDKPLKVILLLRHSFLTDTIWYDVAFFLKSEHYNEKTAKIIIPKELPAPDEILPSY